LRARPGPEPGRFPRTRRFWHVLHHAAWTLLCLTSLGVPPGTPAGNERTVFLGGQLSEEQLVSFTTNVAASGRSGVVLLDSVKASPSLKAFLGEYKPGRI